MSETTYPDPLKHRRQVHAVLIAAGLSLATAVTPSPTSFLSPERRAELAQRFAAQKQLAEVISEDREGR